MYLHNNTIIPHKKKFNCRCNIANIVKKKTCGGSNIILINCCITVVVSVVVFFRKLFGGREKEFVGLWSFIVT